MATSEIDDLILNRCQKYCLILLVGKIQFYFAKLYCIDYMRLKFSPNSNLKLLYRRITCNKAHLWSLKEFDNYKRYCTSSFIIFSITHTLKIS